jgi:tetratricopeptide (TPR) repeat protein
MNEAETEFKKGIKLLEQKNFKGAEVYFKNAYNLNPKKAEYMSYYGLSLTFAEGNPQVGAELCNRAIKINASKQDFYLNLGKVYAKNKDRQKALATLKQGLKLNSKNSEIISEFSNIGQRKRSIIPFLSRNNLFNIYLGKLKTFLEKL